MGRIKVTFSTRGYSGEVSRFVYVESDDPAAPRVQLKISAAVEKLTTASHKLAEAMYKQAASAKAPADAGAAGGAAGAQQGPTGSAEQDNAKGEGEVIDAEVVDGDDKKKN